MPNPVDHLPDLPLTEPAFFILLSVATEPRHGYAILKDVEALSLGRVVFSTGTLYGALKRLLEQGWIERLEEAGPKRNRRARKAYTISALGRRVLAVEVSRLRALIKAARVRSIGQET